jgi:hypothetical protein
MNHGTYRRRAPDGSNVPGNPLRSYRMSMLAHGFVDETSAAGFELDESEPMTYGVVRRHGYVPMAGTIVMALMAAAIIVAAFVFG